MRKKRKAEDFSRFFIDDEACEDSSEDSNEKHVKGLDSQTSLKRARVEQRPTFESLIQGQNSEGFWDKSSEAVLKTFIVNDCVEDAAVRTVLTEMQFSGKIYIDKSIDFNCFYLTLLALYILR